MLKGEKSSFNPGNVNVTGGNVTNVTVTNSNFNAGNINNSIIDDSQITNSTIDGTIIGGTTPASGSFTSLSYTGPLLDLSYVYLQPINGFNITIANTCGKLILDPAGLLAAGTLVMAAAPQNGQSVIISSTKTITLLTLSPNTGQSIVGALASLALGGGAQYLYRSANSTWYRIL